MRCFVDSQHTKCEKLGETEAQNLKCFTGITQASHGMMGTIPSLGALCGDRV